MGVGTSSKLLLLLHLILILIALSRFGPPCREFNLQI
jgi:hypothetical protein